MSAHLEGVDSIIVAAFIGGILAYVYNKAFDVTENNTDIIGAGAAVGAGVQIILRLTGAS